MGQRLNSIEKQYNTKQKMEFCSFTCKLVSGWNINLFSLNLQLYREILGLQCFFKLLSYSTFSLRFRILPTSFRDQTNCLKWWAIMCPSFINPPPLFFLNSAESRNESWLCHMAQLLLRTSQSQKEIQIALDIHKPKRILKYGETLHPTSVSLRTLPRKSVYIYTAKLQFSP